MNALSYAEAAHIVAIERGNRPIVRAPHRSSYTGLSNAENYAQARAMFAAIGERAAWDRRVTEVMRDPIAVAVDEMHMIAGGNA